MNNHHKLAIVEPGCGTRLKWPLFRTLEWAADLRMRLKSGPQAPRGRRPDGLPGQPALPYLWVFVTTIGEVNAIRPFLDALLNETGPRALLLISNHAHYREAYLAKYPEARFTTFQGSNG
jgi:3-deoxy-D-manno-octulosonic-acid transferase